MSQLKTMQDENFAICLPRFARNKRPRFWRIAHALQAAVADASFTPGNRLPSQRKVEEMGRVRFYAVPSPPTKAVPTNLPTQRHRYKKGFAYSSNTPASGRGAI